MTSFFRGPELRDLRRAAAGLALATLAAGISILVAADDVEACGGFFLRTSGERRPSLAYEQALILYDAKEQKEHFVREVAFHGGRVAFGFVVPTPARPEVAKVEKSPFKALRMSFPFDNQPRVEAAGANGFGAGLGALGGGSGGVTVLEVSKVGSFTAFVLAADDAKGLAGWLVDNGLVSTPEAEPWLSYYVRMKFYFVAMRYDPPKDAARSSGLRAETIRISFATPVPYYPYFEPKPLSIAEDAGAPSPRLLDLWLASPAALTPIAAKTAQGKTSWMRPMQSGQVYWAPERTRPALADALHESGLDTLVPEGEVVVQTFQDQKALREGYGDVLFAPIARTPLDPAKIASLRPLLGALDPALVPEKKP